MNADQVSILVVLALTVVMFIWGKWRHDVVAVLSLSACTLLGLIPDTQVFIGFSHPAVVTVACVLVMSYSLQSTGAIDVVANKLSPKTGSPTRTIASLTLLAAIMSAFMNNVGAMALLMPVAIQLATRLGMAPGQVLMPVSFGAILGGMTTLIGTPPNLIVAGFRAEVADKGFGMFSFTPVGASIAVVGVIFLAAIGWRFVPVRQRSDADSFDTGKYLTEVRVVSGGKAEGMTVWELDKALDSSDGQLLGMVRDGEKVFTPHWNKKLKAGDLMIIEAEPEKLSQMLSALGLRLLENVKPDRKGNEATDLGEVQSLKAEQEAPEGLDESEQEVTSEVAKLDVSPVHAIHKTGFEDHQEPEPIKKAASKWFDRRVTVTSERTLRGLKVGMRDQNAPQLNTEPRGSDSSEIVLVEMVVLPNARIIHNTAQELQLRSRYNLNLLAISRQGKQTVERLRRTRIAAGDVILLQGDPERLATFASSFGCVPLAERTIRVPSRKRAVLASVIMLLAIMGAALGIMPAALSFGGGVAAIMAFRLLPLRQVYESIDWSVVILLAALIPVAGAMQSTGAADWLANNMLTYIAQGHALIALGLLLILAMTLSDFMNNAATAAVMCPVALSAAGQLGVNPDAFLMAVAVGASCAFLTPIGHQNNTLILGPGGFRFGDYWRLGLPLELLVVLLSLILLPIVWPLT
ncbi:MULTISPECIES: SLC13 family permease [Gammaproteobacteria]|uniref:SLC13 family permease n=1 Tax=Gammaproteobacteria TaxID=1236 RepID=UPI000DD0CA70|nr:MULTISPECIES: SLC13 family permease [Gammaproteobacteria]RTE86662.1 SLC13 family permease [Aliidiomarina sp. B3213]TCZ90785.1 SLC13 family permease [Lysobacter sp. N42]